MGRMATVYTEVEVDVSLDDFQDDDLIQELEDRGYVIGGEETSNETLTKIWELRRLGKPYERELDQLIYDILGKTI